MTDGRVIPVPDPTPKPVEKRGASVEIPDDELQDAIDMGDESWFWPVGGEAWSVLDVLRALQATRDALAAAEAENERLRAVVAATAEDTRRYVADRLSDARAERDAALAEVGAIREALASLDAGLIDYHRFANHVEQVIGSDLTVAADQPPPEPTVEIGGVVMPESHFNAARYPLLNGDAAPIGLDAMSVEFAAPADPPTPATCGYCGQLREHGLHSDRFGQGHIFVPVVRPEESK